MADTSSGDPLSPSHSLTISTRFLRFFLTGGVGFLIEAVILTWLVTGPGLNIYLGRAVSFSVAVTVTWLLNRRFAFADLASRERKGEYSRYFLVQIAGAVINLGVFVALVSGWTELKSVPVIPLAAGAAVALFFNFGASRWLVFRGDQD